MQYNIYLNTYIGQHFKSGADLDIWKGEVAYLYVNIF